jgi:hypothetical protein
MWSPFIAMSMNEKQSFRNNDFQLARLSYIEMSVVPAWEKHPISCHDDTTFWCIQQLLQTKTCKTLQEKHGLNLCSTRPQSTYMVLIVLILW